MSGRRVSLALSVVAVVLALGFCTYFFLSLMRLSHFRDSLIAGRYEGSFSEDLGFLTALTSRVAAGEGRPTGVQPEKIKDYLLKMKSRLEALRTPAPAGAAQLGGLANIEELTDQDRLLSLMTPAHALNVPRSSFGLVAVESPPFRNRPYLTSNPSGDSTRRRGSFVFVPATLIDGSAGSLEIPLRVRREIIFSKIVEGLLPRGSDSLTSLGVFQSFFISFSGSLRVVSHEADDQIKYYSTKFGALQSLSDRPYFIKTAQAPRRFRISAPYIDVAGGGLVRTYSVFIENRALDVSGIVGMDQRISPTGSFLEETGFGDAVRRDFKVFIHSTGAPSPLGPDRWQRSARQAIARFEALGGPRLSNLQRLDLKELRCVVFAFPLSPGKVAYFVLDQEGAIRKYSLFLFLYIVSILSISFILIYFIYYYRRTGDVEDLTVKSARLHSDIMERLHGGFAIIDDHGHLRYTNSRFNELARQTAHSPNPTIESYFPPATLQEFRKRTESHEPFEFAANMRRNDGTEYPAIIASSPISYEESSDNQMLIIIPSRELEIAIASKFLHVFSHTLKTPVHSILLIADLFRRKKALPKFDYYFSLMKKQANEFSLMVNDVLRFSRLELEEMQPARAPENLANLLRSALSSVREKAAKAGIDLQTNVPDRVRAKVDSKMMGVVFNNLIDNALKYTREGGSLEVSLTDQLSSVTISFTDSGIGVGEEDARQIFRPFFRSQDPAVQSQEGLGIGLYLSRRYIELHQGKLEYEAVLDSGPAARGDKPSPAGSRFVITLPKD